MQIRRHTKLIREGDYVAEVHVEFIGTEEPWAPYLSMDDACKLDDVRLSLCNNDLETASKLARVYRLTPINAA